MPSDIKAFLDECVARYNCGTFIETDPISIPHRFSKKQDIEIMGFWAAMLAWGQRKTIINSANRLVELMDGAPHDFIINHTESDRQKFLSFKHRTFQATDTLYFLAFFQQYYRQYSSLEDAFRSDAGCRMPVSPAASLWRPKDARPLEREHPTVNVKCATSNFKPETKNIQIPNTQYPILINTIESALSAFHHLFFSLPDAPSRTRKHIATPERKSTCKRLNMFLRWMVRKDDNGVDFGIWNQLKPSQLLIPLDVHVDRVARQYGLLQRPKSDWQAVLELTETLRGFDSEDPVKYDFALFGLGILEKEQLKKGMPLF